MQQLSFSKVVFNNNVYFSQKKEETKEQNKDVGNREKLIPTHKTDTTIREDRKLKSSRKVVNCIESSILFQSQDFDVFAACRKNPFLF